MVKVSNLKITEENLKIPKEYDMVKYIPKFKKQIITFELSGSFIEIYNALRRAIKMDQPVKCFSTADAVFDTDDKVLIDEVLRTIELIPLKQNCPIGNTFSLNFINKTTKQKAIYSSVIKSKDTIKYVDDTYLIATIASSKYINISNITVSAGIGIDHSRYSNVGNLIFLPNEEKETATITFETHGTKEPKRIVFDACNNLINRFDKFLIELERCKMGQNMTSDYMSISFGDEVNITIYNETMTLIMPIVKTLMINYPKYNIIKGDVVHPAKKEVYLNIAMEKPLESIKKSISELIIYFRTIQKSFK
jgi:DNA-directed RNA polymerase subunit L